MHSTFAKQFVAVISDKAVGFISVLHFPHSRVRNLKKVHRLVVLPDYQGIGIGKILLNTVAKIYVEQKNVFGITTSHPALNKSLQYDKNWRLGSIGRQIPHRGLISLRHADSSNRLTCSWFYKI